jgi:glucose dehydrogenase
MTRGLTTVSAIALLSAFGFAGSAFAQVTQERLENADSEPENWLIPYQNYSSHRFSRLDEINRDNVGDLKLAFAMSLDDPLRGDNNDNESPILVDNGIAWVEAHSGMLYRLDMSSGNDAVLPCTRTRSSRTSRTAASSASIARPASSSGTRKSRAPRIPAIRA